LISLNNRREKVLPAISNGSHQLLPSFFPDTQVRIDSHPVGLLYVPLWSTLVYLRMQVLQIEDLSPLYQQSLDVSNHFGFNGLTRRRIRPCKGLETKYYERDVRCGEEA
jgi:hypothetical protein